MAEKKVVVVSLVSFVLVVGVVIGVAAVVVNRGVGDSTNKTPTSTQAVTNICQATEFKETCTRTLGEVANKNPNATPKDYVMASISATAEEAMKSKDVTGSLEKDLAKTPQEDDRFMACQEYLDFALGDLDESLKIVNDSQVHLLGERVDELLKLLTAVRVDLTTCLDEIMNPEQKAAMENALLNTTLLTYNAQDIVWGIIDILKSFGISPLNPPPSANARRLLEEAEVVKREGYPSWFPTADRKLLGASPPPNAVVAKDGSGQFKTIRDALASYPQAAVGFKGRFVIYVKAGIYDERVKVDEKQVNVLMYGDGRGKTIITGRLNKHIMGLGTDATGTLTVIGKGFIGKSMTVRNTAGPEGHQAVAVRVQADHVAFFDCNIEGYQDTLYYHQKDQFYKNCAIYGTVDFIFGSGQAVIQDSDIIVRKPGPGQSNMVTADGRNHTKEHGGVVLQNCRIMDDKDLNKERLTIATYLGRPWKRAARTIVMESYLGDLIRPEGFVKWSDDPKEKYHETCFYREYRNWGPGSPTNQRVKWRTYRNITNRSEVVKYTPRFFIKSDYWLKDTGVPFYSGFSTHQLHA